MPPPAVRAALAAAAHEVPLRQGRRIPASHLHVTLAFVGTIDPTARAACERAASAVAGEPFELVFERAGHFRRAGVVWLGLAAPSPALEALVARLRAALRAVAVRCDPKPFHCHLTIARAAGLAPGAPRLPAVRWSVREFALMESVADGAGVRYETRARWPLRPAARDETTSSPVR